MSDFDVIIIGSGHNAMILAGYLGKAGERVLLLERRMEFGGGLCSIEFPGVPGFYVNHHATNFSDFAYSPVVTDLELPKYCTLLTPPVKIAQILPDGRALVIYDDIELTCKSIAQFSQRDAKVYREVATEWIRLAEKFAIPEWLNPPRPMAERQALYSKSADGRRYLQIIKRTPLEVADEIFETDILKCLLIYMIDAPSSLPDEPGIDGTLIKNFRGWTHLTVCKGGSHDLSHALEHIVAQNRGLLLEHAPVRQILLEDGRAVGVRTSDGRTFRASKCVVSNIDLEQTFGTLLDGGALSSEQAAFSARMRGYEMSELSIFGVYLAMKEPPRHHAAKKNPDVDRAIKWNVGQPTFDRIPEARRMLRSGEVASEASFGAGCMTLFDRTQGPRDGGHVSYLWQPAPYELKDGGAARWDELKVVQMERCLKTWRDHADNLDEANILGKIAYSPLDIERTLVNMRRGAFSGISYKASQLMEHRPPYRTAIPNLYLCGSHVHPGGNLRGYPGYITAGVICEDYGIPRWWPRRDVCLD